MRERLPSSSLTPAGEATHSLPPRSSRKSNATRRLSGSFKTWIHEVAVVHAAGSAASRDQQIAVWRSSRMEKISLLGRPSFCV